MSHPGCTTKKSIPLANHNCLQESIMVGDEKSQLRIQVVGKFFVITEDSPQDNCAGVQLEPSVLPGSKSVRLFSDSLN